MSAAANITGQRFGRLIALRPTDGRNAEGVLWECGCDCGKRCLVSVKSLRSGNTTSCGCAKTEREDLTDRRYGLLTVTADSGERYRGHTIWICRCDCGGTVKVRGSLLKSGNTRSCGCWNIKRPHPAPPDTVDGTRVSAMTARTPKNNTSGVKGVSWNSKKRKWEAYIKFKGRKCGLGLYADIKDAAAARKAAEQRVFGDFLRELRDSNG